MKKASGRKRILALLIDYAICVLIVLLVLSATIPWIINWAISGEFLTFFDVWQLAELIRWLVVAIIIIMAYFTLVPVIIPGQTLGKKALRIKVIQKDGSKVTFSSMFVRELIGRLLFDFTSLGVTTILSLVLMASRREALHDSLADTNVIEL